MLMRDGHHSQQTSSFSTQVTTAMKFKNEYHKGRPMHPNFFSLFHNEFDVTRKTPFLHSYFETFLEIKF